MQKLFPYFFGAITSVVIFFLLYFFLSVQFLTLSLGHTNFLSDYFIHPVTHRLLYNWSGVKNG